jgi:hypothetical protein
LLKLETSIGHLDEQARLEQACHACLDPILNNGPCTLESDPAGNCLRYLRWFCGTEVAKQLAYRFLQNGLWHVTDFRESRNWLRLVESLSCSWRDDRLPRLSWRPKVRADRWFSKGAFQRLHDAAYLAFAVSQPVGGPDSADSPPKRFEHVLPEAVAVAGCC